ncbi:MAG: hypothetical protein EP332_09035 [Bacteroidetes bacterium]|nr:MAG: hypothetical protein EP332_09035 [Bacteroidota bacterium]
MKNLIFLTFCSVITLTACRSTPTDSSKQLVDPANFFSELKADDCHGISITFQHFVHCTQRSIDRIITVHAYSADSALVNENALNRYSITSKGTQEQVLNALQLFGSKLCTIPHAQCGGYRNSDTLVQVQIFHQGIQKSHFFYCKKESNEEDLFLSLRLRNY